MKIEDRLWLVKVQQSKRGVGVNLIELGKCLVLHGVKLPASQHVEPVEMDFARRWRKLRFLTERWSDPLLLTYCRSSTANNALISASCNVCASILDNKDNVLLLVANFCRNPESGS